MGLRARRETDERACDRRGLERAGENPDKGVGVIKLVAGTKANTAIHSQMG